MGRTILVTGGAGFIGSNFVFQRIAAGERVVNLDKLTYAGNLGNLASIIDRTRAYLRRREASKMPLWSSRCSGRTSPMPWSILPPKATSTARIASPEEFISTNLVGTFRLLHEALAYYRALAPEAQSRFRFLHVSTDEVYGSLGPDDPAFTETHPYRAQQSLLGLQGRQRSSGARLPAHLRTAHAHHQLLQQLRPLSVSRKIDSARHPQCPQRQAAAHLWRRAQRARLALRGRSLRGHRPGARNRGPSGETYNIGGNSEMANSKWSRRSAPSWTRFTPRALRTTA